MMSRWGHLFTVDYQVCVNEGAIMNLDGVRVGPTLLYMCVQLFTIMVTM